MRKIIFLIFIGFFVLKNSANADDTPYKVKLIHNINNNQFNWEYSENDLNNTWKARESEQKRQGNFNELVIEYNENKNFGMQLGYYLFQKQSESLIGKKTNIGPLSFYINTKVETNYQWEKFNLLGTYKIDPEIPYLHTVKLKAGLGYLGLKASGLLNEDLIFKENSKLPVPVAGFSIHIQNLISLDLNLEYLKYYLKNKNSATRGSDISIEIGKNIFQGTHLGIGYKKINNNININKSEFLSGIYIKNNSPYIFVSHIF